MFAVSQTLVTNNSPTATFYTRAGNFTPDSTGNLANASGFYLLGWPLNAQGNPPANPASLTTINVNDLAGKAVPSTEMTLQANLQSSDVADTTYNPGDMTAGNVTPQFQRTINVYDSQGGTQPLELSFLKTGANTWAYEVSYQGSAANISSANPLAQGTMSSMPTARLPTPHDSEPRRRFDQRDHPVVCGIRPQLADDRGQYGHGRPTSGFAQFDAPSALVSSSVDGAVAGSVSGMSGGLERHRLSPVLERNVAEDLPGSARQFYQSRRALGSHRKCVRCNEPVGHADIECARYRGRRFNSVERT